MNADELRDLIENNIDVQLHSHRHRLPADNIDATGKEISENRQELAKVCDSFYVHLCYPSGQRRKNQWRRSPALRK